jgi:hypothetical protein
MSDPTLMGAILTALQHITTIAGAHPLIYSPRLIEDGVTLEIVKQQWVVLGGAARLSAFDGTARNRIAWRYPRLVAAVLAELPQPCLSIRHYVLQ